MLNRVNVVSNTVSETSKLLRDYNLNVLTTHKKEKKELYDVIEVLASALVVILLQYINVSNQDIVHLTQCYLSITSQIKITNFLKCSFDAKEKRGPS